MSEHRCAYPRWRRGRFRHRAWICRVCDRAWLSHYQILHWSKDPSVPDVGAWRWTEWRPRKAKR